jgi:predicted acylesterase/phospholipase RssA
MFEQVVFAGGGHRCWWQAGFWDVVAPEIELRPKLIAGVSAGAATACLIYANNSQDALDYYDQVLPAGSRNVYWRNALRRGAAVFPHNEIYQGALRALIGGANFKQLMLNAPEIRIQFARIPRWLGPRTAVGVGMIAYNIEKYAKRSLHPTFGKRLGFTQEVARVQDCHSEEELVALIIASSCTPPFTPIQYRNGRPTMDGGLVDNVPVSALDRTDVSTLVLTTRRYPQHGQIFTRGHCVYVQPSQKTPVASWDYTAPKLYRKTYELGRIDGESFIDAFFQHDQRLRYSGLDD